MQEPVKAPEELPGGEAGGGRGKEEGEKTQEPIIQPIPTELNPTANAKTTYSPLPVAPSIDQVYILSTPGAYQRPKHHLQKPPHLCCPCYKILGS